MSENIVTKERVYVTAGAVATLGASAIVAVLIKRHVEAGREVVAEHMDDETAEELGVSKVFKRIRHIIRASIVIVGPDIIVKDKKTGNNVTTRDTSAALEVHVVGPDSDAIRISRAAMSGGVHLYPNDDSERAVGVLHEVEDGYGDGGV